MIACNFARRNGGFLAALILLMAGCGGGPPMGKVSGTVSLDGKPMSFGTVMMQHVEGGQPSRGEIQPDGTFVMSTFHPEDGARVGENRIRVTAYSTQDPRTNPGGASSGALGVLVIPEAYGSFGASGLKADVEPGDNPPLNLELTSGGKKARR
ncbi:hypothetical protein Pla108_39230 [Botrimarina colliarenosi]|uniref:Carboxypeptidase regulatory-like domain-containing protein n=1 Tax=Botrimarina colliarenosi TaxID=2528001 RepID=A0A5C6A1I5_9BACT|nr:hypothetical protein [Botrimarina colliarenosi]TWT93429.1 hypothetical protein Pla108_39230 [Botrimarina colliarenosi]